MTFKSWDDKSMSTAGLLIHFLVSPQLDFIGLSNEMPNNLENPGNQVFPRVHIGEQMARKLRGSGIKGDDPFVDFTLKLIQRENPVVRIVTDEDWHTPQSDEFEAFGEHCLMGSLGAQLPGRLEEKRWIESFSYIRANSLNIRTDPRFCDEMSRLIKDYPKKQIRISISGVYSHMKIDYLIFNLHTLEPRIDPGQIAVCEFLCASPSMDDHQAAMRKFEQMHVRIARSEHEFEKWLSESL